MLAKKIYKDIGRTFFIPFGRENTPLESELISLAKEGDTFAQVVVKRFSIYETGKESGKLIKIMEKEARIKCV